MCDNVEAAKAIVILGAGIMQIPAIMSAKRKGLIAIVFDGNSLAPGRDVAHHFENVDLKECERLLEKCMEYGNIYHIAGVFTAGTDFSYVVAWLSGKLGLKSISYETALKATDKSKMRNAFREGNVPSPGFIITDGKDIDTVKVKELGFPLVVKPVDSMGARGTARVNNNAELAGAVSSAVKYSRSGRVIIEQYIEGPEFSLDAVIKDGRIHVCGIADRHIFFPPYFVEMGHTMPSSYPQEVKDNVAAVFCEGIRAIGIDNGSAKGDIKYSTKGAVVGEIAARLSGGYMSGWTFPYSTGFSVIDAALDIAVGGDPGSVNYSYDYTAAERAFISIPGIVESIDIPDYIKKRGHDSPVRDLFINVKAGDSVSFPKNNVEKCGNIIAVHGKRGEAISHAEDACRDIFIRLKSSDEKTFEFIFGGKEGWIPDAYSIKGSRIEEMRDYYGTPDLNKIRKEGIYAAFPEGLSISDESCGLDWQGRPLEETIRQIEKITGLKLLKSLPVPLNGSFILGRIFWKGVVRGSVQGGVWVIETIIDFLGKGKDLKNIKW